MKPENIGGAMRQFIAMGLGQVLSNFTDNIDFAKEGSQLMQVRKTYPSTTYSK